MAEKKIFMQPYTDVAVLQRDMEQMDDAEQRRFMRGLTMETHISLHRHILDEEPYKQKVDQMHAALFDPMNGLVNLKRWMCRLATWAGVGLGATASLVAGIASAGHSFGWW